MISMGLFFNLFDGNSLEPRVHYSIPRIHYNTINNDQKIPLISHNICFRKLDKQNRRFQESACILPHDRKPNWDQERISLIWVGLCLFLTVDLTRCCAVAIDLLRTRLLTACTRITGTHTNSTEQNSDSGNLIVTKHHSNSSDTKLRFKVIKISTTTTTTVKCELQPNQPFDKNFDEKYTLRCSQLEKKSSTLIVSASKFHIQWITSINVCVQIVINNTIKSY